jgi:hypothetical protein
VAWSKSVNHTKQSTEDLAIRIAEPRPTGALRAPLGTIVAASAAPYGYTVTLWSSGAVLLRSHGAPHVGDVFAFAAGALAAFSLMALLARGALARMESVDDAADRVWAGALNWFAVGAAVGAVALLAEIHGREAWPLGSFAATALYILAASLQLTVVATRRKQPSRAETELDM